jgi:hypothetical protein
MTRHRLPSRRVAETHAIAFNGRAYLVTVGRYEDGRIGEVFASASKQGSHIEAMLSNACVLASLALQHGASPADMARSMLRVPAMADAFGSGVAPACPVAAVVDLLAELEGGA